MIEILHETSENVKPMVLYENAFGENTTASTEAVGKIALNVTNGETFSFWEATAFPARIYSGTITSVNADCLYIGSHTLFSDGCSVSLEKRVGVDWIEVFSYTPVSDDQFMVLFEETATETWGWRISITGSTLPTIGVIMLGKRLTFPFLVEPSYKKIRDANRVEILGGTTISGHFVKKRFRRKGSSTSVSFTRISEADISTSIRDFADYFNSGGHFVFASSPLYIPNDFALSWRSQSGSEFEISFVDQVNVSPSMEIECYVD